MNRSSRALLGVALVVSLSAGFWLGIGRARITSTRDLPRSLQAGETPTFTPESLTPDYSSEPPQGPTATPDPIYTEEAAIALSKSIWRASFEELPEGEIVTRLVSGEQFFDWSFVAPGVIVPPTAVPLLTPEPPIPIWIVALITDGLTVPDAMFVYNEDDASTPIQGVYIAWSAATGQMIELGALDTRTGHNAPDLLTLPNEPLVIPTPPTPPTP